jgi:AAA+ ATPase superfamily predicted ATPase
MPLNFDTALYGRQAETNEIFRRFEAGKNLLMPGLRRLGKTFVLERLECRSAEKGYTAVRFDVSHCRDEKEFFAKLCQAVEAKRGQGDTLLASLEHRMKPLFQSSSSTTDPWYQAALNQNWESFADHLISHISGR